MAGGNDTPDTLPADFDFKEGATPETLPADFSFGDEKKKPTSQPSVDGSPQKLDGGTGSASAPQSILGTQPFDPSKLSEAPQPPKVDVSIIKPDTLTASQKRERLNALLPKLEKDYKEKAALEPPTKQPIIEDQSFMGSVSNTVSNIGTSLEGVIPRYRVFAADVGEKIFGKDVLKGWYLYDGLEAPEKIRSDSYAKLAKLDNEVKQTQGIYENLKNGNAKGLAAGVVDAVGQVVSTAVPTVLTGGAGLVTETVGRSIVDYNNAKAEAKGITVDELYKNGEADFNTPVAIGTVATALEKLGLKGMSKAISRNITKKGLKNTALIMWDVNKEGLTEWIQLGLETANIGKAQGLSDEQIADNVKNELFSSKGVENYLMGVVGSGGVVGIGKVFKSINNPKRSEEVQALEAKRAEAIADLSNPNVSPETKEALIDVVYQAGEDIDAKVNEDIAEYQELSDEGKKELDNTISQIDARKQIISDPNISEATKKTAEEEIKTLYEKADTVIKDGKKAKEEITPKTTQDAVQEQKPAEMDVRQQAEDGKEMGEGNQADKAVAEQGKAEEKIIEQKTDEKTQEANIPQAESSVNESIKQKIKTDFGAEVTFTKDGFEVKADNKVIQAEAEDAVEAMLKETKAEVSEQAAEEIKPKAEKKKEEKFRSKMQEVIKEKIAELPEEPQTEYEKKLKTFDKEVQYTDLSKLSEGDYIRVPQSSKSSGASGIVKKINPKNVIIETQYMGKPMELSVKKSDIDKFLKPKEQTGAAKPKEKKVKKQKANPLQQFVDIVSDSKTFDDAFKKVKKVTGVSAETSKAFYDEYNPSRNKSMEVAFRNFYNDVKKGNKKLSPKEREALGNEMQQDFNARAKKENVISAEETKKINDDFLARQKELEKYLSDDELQEEKIHDEVNRILNKISNEEKPTQSEIDYVNENAWLPKGYKLTENGLEKSAEKRTKNRFTGAEITPNSEVKTDVDTVVKELGLDEASAFVYEQFRSVPSEDRPNVLSKLTDKLDDDENSAELRISDINDSIDELGGNIVDTEDDIDNKLITKSEGAKKIKEAELKIKKLQDEKSEREQELVDIKKRKEKVEAFTEGMDYPSYKVIPNDEAIDELLNRVNTRLETRQRVKAGTDLFPEQANIAEIAKKFANKIREGKLNKKGTLGVNTPASIAVDLAIETAAQIVEKGGSAAQAIADGIKQLRDSEAWKNASERVRKAMEEMFSETVEAKAKEFEKENPPTKPKEEGESEGGKEKKVVGRAAKGKFTHEEVKEKLKEIGLTREVKSIEEAIKLADKIIEEIGVDGAVEAVRRGDITESEAAIVMGRAIDNAHQEFKEATTEKEKDIAAQKEADLLNELDAMNVSRGRFIGAMNKVYQLSPLGYKKYARKKIENANNEALDKVKKKLDEAEKQVEASKKEAADLMDTNIELKMKLDALQGKKSKSTLTPEKAQRKKELKAEIFGRYNDITTFARLLADKEAMEYVGLVFEEAGGDFKAFAKEVINTLGKKLKEHVPALWKRLGGKIEDIIMPSESELQSTIRKGLEELYGENANKKLIEIAKEYFTEGQKAKGELVDFLVEKTGLEKSELEPYAKVIEEVYDKILNKRVLNIINQIFPLSPLTKRKGLKEYERIVQAINVGLKTGKRKDGTKFEFEKEFYNKFGLVDVNEPSISKKLDEFAEKIYESRNEENPLYQNMATIQLLDWIANRQQENRIVSGLTEQLYANMLYGEDTHIRNSVFNAQVVFSAMAQQIAQNPKAARTILKAFGKNWEQGVTEMKNIIMTGMPKSGSEVKARAFHERAKDINGFLNIWTKYANKPSRLLQAFDALQNFPMRKSKVASILIEEAKKSNPTMPIKDIIEQVNNVLYGDEAQQAEWRIKAEEQTQKYYGLTEPMFINEKRNPVYADKKYNEAYRNYKRSFYNLQDSNLKDESIFEEAKDYADTKFLMNKPKGWFGLGANLLNQFGEATGGVGKVLTTPFVNVPFNIAAHMFEFSPLGYLSVAAGKEGKGLNPDYAKKHTIDTDYSERRKRDLLWKATAGTIGMGTVYALTQITYYDDDEDKERPVLIVMADGTGNYIQNKKLEKLSGSDKFEEYTIDFMGVRIPYKYSPFAAMFLPSGYMMDAQRYGDKGLGATPDHVEQLAKASAGYLLFMKDQSSVSGIMDLLNIGERSGFKKEKTSDKAWNMTKEFGAKTLRNLTTPNFIPQSYRHYKGLFGGDETMSDGFVQTLSKDIPFADQFAEKRYDHFGKPINAKWKIPGIYNEPQKDDKFYQLAKDKNYIDKLRYFTQSSIDADKKSYPLTSEQTRNIDRLRAKYAGEQIEKLYPQLSDTKLSNKKFSDYINEIYNNAQKRAINELGIIPGEQISNATNESVELKTQLGLLKEIKKPTVEKEIEAIKDTIIEENVEEYVKRLKKRIEDFKK